MVESAPRPRLEHVAELVTLVAGHAEQHGYDPVMGLMQIVAAYNSQERDIHEKRRSDTGALGFYPNNGRPLNPDDTGASMAKIEKRSDGIVYVDMGQMVVNWFALSASGARDFGKNLIEVANEPTPAPARSGHPSLPGLP